MFRKIQIPNYDYDHLPLFTCLIVGLVLLKSWYWNKAKSQANLVKLPPGPWTLPVIGNLHQLALAGSLPHHFLKDLAKKYGPMMHLKLGQVSAIVISSPELAKQVLKTHGASAFLSRPNLLAMEVITYNNSGMVFSPYNDYWREMRKICVLELLSAKRVQSFASLREEETWNLVQSIKSSSSQPHDQPSVINLSEMIFSMVNSITARAAFGKKFKHQQEFISLVQEVNRLGSSFDVPDLFPSLKFLYHVTRTKSALETIHGKMDRILEEIINDHQQVTAAAGEHDMKEDLVHVLIQLQDSGDLQFELTTNHVKAVTLEMYTAGSETSASTIEWAMSELLRNPRAMEKAQAEVRKLVAGKRKIQEADIKKLDYLKFVIKETLRLHGPAAFISRQATERCKIGGYDIPYGAKVLVNAWAIGRDPKHWGANANCFEPERFQGSSIDFRGANFELLPFGAGKRMCPGISFATATIELALCQLLYFFNWKLSNGANPQELDMTEGSGITARKRNELNVIAIPFFP